jgi:hypothetical protein
MHTILMYKYVYAYSNLQLQPLAPTASCVSLQAFVVALLLLSVIFSFTSVNAVSHSFFRLASDIPDVTT